MQNNKNNILSKINYTKIEYIIARHFTSNITVSF